MTQLQLFDLAGKKALITGGNRGIGRACATALALAGAEVAIVGRDEDAGSHAAASIAELGRRAFFVRCDISDPAQVEHMMEAVVRRMGRLDIAVNNAGIYRPGADESLHHEDWDVVIKTNLKGAWLCARAEMQQMARQSPRGGKIINVGSIAASIACSNGPYDASKAGLIHLTKTLAARWGRYGITVNCLSPGYLTTGVGANRSAQQTQMVKASTPVGRVMQLEDLYGPVLFLASAASDYVTGQNLVVDGGHTLSTWLTVSAS